MAGLSPYVVGLALAVLVLANFAASQEKCRSGCHGVTPNLFKFADGTTYKYNLDGTFDIQVSSAEGQVSTTKVKATVLLTQLPQCNQILRLQNVQVIGANGKTYNNIPNIEKPVRLNFHDGHVEDLICAEKGDTQVSLNVKRAVASLFQANPKKQYETDVFGVCPTDVTTKKEGNLFIINKHKNLNKCSHRESIRETFMATAFNLDSEMKTTPLMSSNYHSEQKIKNGILDHVTVTEDYLYVPYSEGKKGITATVTTKLQFIGQSKENPKASCTEAKSILFENPHHEAIKTSNSNNLIAAIREAANSITSHVSEHTAKGFLNVISIMRTSNKNDLLTAFSQIKNGANFNNKKIAQKFYFDALVRVGTGESIEAAIELLKKNEIDCELTKAQIYLGLSFARHATPTSVLSALSLLDEKDVKREAYLGVGSLAGTYCKQHPNCGSEDAIKKLTQKFISKLGDGKCSSRVQENEMIYILKAIKNMHYIEDSVAAKVITIANNKNAPSRLRVAALETFLADACKDKFRDSAINILKDMQQDSEIRIKAYLAAAQCPNGKVATAVKKIVDDEPSIQVKGYIVSHLRNIKASTSPDKELAKQQLGNINVNKVVVPIDFRRFSQNLEFSNTIDTLGIASTTEADLIFSQSSFLPRSTSLNLTAELFGHRYNFLEVTTRQENLDKILEHYLGPLGVFNEPDAGPKMEQLINSYKEHIGQRASKLAQLSRRRRDVTKAEIENIAKQIQIKTNEFNKDLDIDLSIKVLGSEVGFYSLTENSKELSPSSLIDKLFDSLDQGFEKVKNFDETIHNNQLLLDIELAYPTSLGFPLKIDVDAASSVLLQTKGSIDIIACLAQVDSTIAKLSMIPSANIEVTGTLTVDTYFVENGFKVASNLYTATGGAAELTIFSDKASGYDLKYSLPLQKQELVSFNHELLFSAKERGHSEVSTPLKFKQGKDFEVCADNVSPYIGLTFCAQINRPNSQQSSSGLAFPLDGHSKFGITIIKEDLKEYHIKDLTHSDDNLQKYEFLYEVIGEKEKKLSIEGVLSLTPETLFKLNFLAQGQLSGGLLGKLVDTNTEKSVLLKYHMNDMEAYAKAGFLISGGGKKFILKPILDYKYPNLQGKPYQVNGQIVLTKDATSKYTFENFKIITPEGSNIIVKGYVGYNPSSYFSDISVGDGKHTGTLKGKAEVVSDGVKVNAELQNTFNPEANLKLNYAFKHGGNTIYDSSLVLVHGKDLNSKTNELKLINTLINSIDETDKSSYVSTKNEFKYPLKQIEAKCNFGETRKSVHYDVDVKYQDVKFGSELDFKFDQKTEGDYDLEFELYGVKSKLELKSKRLIKGDKSDIVNLLDINGKKLELKGTITHIEKDTITNYSGDLVMKVPNQNDPIKVGYGFIIKGASLDTLLKVQSGGTVLIDNFAKLTNEGDANAQLKVNFKDVFIANGQLKATKGKGSGNILLDFCKVGRKVKSEVQYTIVDPVYNIELTAFTDWEKDNKKKYVFISHNKVDEKGLDSQNSYEYQGQKFQTNLKASFDEDFMDGKQMVEAEVIFPNELYLAGKVNREMHMTEEEVINGKLFVNLEVRKKKNEPGMKFTFQGAAKNTDLAEDIYDVTCSISVDDGAKKNLNGDFSLFRQPKTEDNWLVDIKSKLYGSVMPNTYEGNVHSECSEEVGSYKIDIKYGPKNTLDINGKYDLEGETRPISGEIGINLHTSSPQFAVLKFHTAGSLGLGLKENIYAEGHSSTTIFVDDDGTDPATKLDLKCDGNFMIGDKDSEFKSTIKFQNEDPISVALTYSYDEDEQKKTSHFRSSSAITYAKDKTFKCDVTLEEPNEHEFTLDAKVLTPNDKARNTRFQWHVKTDETETKVNSDFKITADGKVYQLLSDIDSNENTPSIMLKLKHPDGKFDELSAKVKKSNPKAFAGDFKLSSAAKNFALTSSIDAQVESVDDFNIKLNIDCPVWKLEKVVVEALNKGGKGGKKIQFTAKSGDKNLISGSTNYKTHQDGGKYIIEGSGSFKVKEESKTANFKYSTQDLHMDKDGEEGIDMSFDASIGSNAVDAELKVTNKHFRFSNSYCEEKKQCAHVEVDSKVNAADANEFNHVLEVNVDLRKLGLSHEFGLKSETISKGYVLDHTVDVHFQSQANSKYQYSLYTHPNKAGVSLTTPKRCISIEGIIEANKDDKLEGHLAIYMDKKNKPNEKSILSGYIMSKALSSTAGHGKGLLKFSTPGLGKDLVYEYTSKYDATTLETTTTIDVFTKPNQKIIVNTKTVSKDNTIDSVATIKSAGLNIDIASEEKLSFDPQTYSAKYHANTQYKFDKIKFSSSTKAEINPDSFVLYVKAIDKDLINIHGKGSSDKDHITWTTSAAIYGLKPTISTIELSKQNTLKATFARKENPNNKLIVNAGFIAGQIADARAEIYKGGKKIDLIHGSVKLDEANFLKSDYGLKLEELKSNLLEPTKNEIVQAAEKQKELYNNMASESATYWRQTADIYKKHSPNFTPAREYYTNELAKVKNEFVSDKTLEEFTDFLKEVFGATAQSISEIFTKVLEYTEKIYLSFQNAIVKVTEAVETEFIPKLKVLQDQIGGLFGKIFEVTTDTFFTFLAKISQFIDAHQSEIKGITTSVSSVLSDITRAIFKAADEAKAAISQEIQNLLEEIRALSFVEQLQHQFTELTKDLDFTEILVNFISEGYQLKSFVDSKELQDLIQEVTDYLIKKVKRQPCDDKAAIESIVKHLTVVLNQIVSSVDVSDDGVPKKPAVNLDYLSKLPRLVGAKSSTINWLLDDHTFTEEQFLYNVAFNPALWVPPFQLQAILLQGGHIFTFDSKHLTFPGTCNYLLARDALNGNFTIAGTFDKGVLTALTVADKHDSVTVKSNGQCQVNNAASEYPIYKSTIQALKEYNAIIITSNAGVKVVCDYNLKGCMFYISGFYHGQVKGLLGNGNSEPYDDFTLPNGKIVTGEAEFGNAYKLQASCQAVKTVDHKHHSHAKQCTEYFASDDSALSDCFPFIPPALFRMACDHGAAANDKEILKLTASGYASACNARGIPIDIPDEFITCTNGDKPRNLDDSFTVINPGKAADVVIVIDETKTNEVVFKELIQPLINELNKGFNAKKCTDIEYHFIGYGGESKHKPLHYTVAGKFTSKGKLPNIKFTDTPITRPKPHEELMTLFGLNVQARAYDEAVNYPFRAHAYKTVIAVTGKPCDDPSIVSSEMLSIVREIRELFLEDDGLSINLITPVHKDFSCKDAKTTPTVIGFNKEKVFTYADFKKKTFGSAELRNSLSYDDYCIDYTINHGGNVFITNNFLSAKKPQRPQFAAVAAHNIVHQLTSNNQKWSCDCERVNFYSAKNVCTPYSM